MLTKNILLIAIAIFLSACGSDRSADVANNSGVLGVVESDDDSDGISNEDEVNIYFTNPDSNDTDNDGLSDGEEILLYDTNATNPDTDGDCLLDSYEIKYYETNATNADTDNDKIPDGIEIYSYSPPERNVTCLSNPEVLSLPHNPSPAIDNLQTPDVINALDPIKDSDGDGISDDDELLLGTNPNNSDSDGDGLIDGEELTHGTNPLVSDTDGDGLSDGLEVHTYGTNPTNPDSDEDGIRDGQEVNIGTNPLDSDSDRDGLSDGKELEYGVNPLVVDSDGDGLSDGDEVHTYGTNPASEDSDNDGLKDNEEINTYDTNASNPDTDGDCLLDSFEILYYETNASNVDTDGDSINDGIEIYSYNQVITTSCIDRPETLDNGHNRNPAKDAIPNVVDDVIDALDPSNDSDGDGQANIKELECADGNASNKNVMCPYLTDGSVAASMNEHGYAYVPGGFDVDGDGINEGGFWMSRYQARVTSDGSIISSETVILDVGNINKYVSSNFKVLNKNIQVTNYMEGTLSETTTFAGKKLDFAEPLAKIEKRVTGITPYLALVSLNRCKILDRETFEELDYNITMPTLKQYTHVKMLLDADYKGGGDGRHIRNGLLGIDVNIPLFDYTLVIDEFGEANKEYVRNLVQIRDIYGTKSFDVSMIPKWWGVDNTKVDILNSGANATQDLGFGIGPQKDAYAVLVRAGTVLDVTQGISGALSDDEGTTNGISFRAATDYLY